MYQASSVFGVGKGRGQGGNKVVLVPNLEFGDSIYRTLQSFYSTKQSVCPLWLNLNECQKLAEDSQP